MDAKTIQEVLNVLSGQLVTVINPQSYIRTLTGYEVDVETYTAKVISFEGDTLKILTEYVRDPHKKAKEKVYQFIPSQQIRRITISKSERFLTLA